MIIKNKIQVIVITVLILFLSGIVVFLNQRGKDKNNSSGTFITERKTYQSEEYKFSLQYPESWHHRSVNKDALTMPALETGVWPQALEEFGSGDLETWNQPFYPDDGRVSFSVMILQKRNGYSDTQIIDNLGFGGDNVLPITIGGKSSLYYIDDDTQHVIESARMYRKVFLILTGNLFYEIFIATRDQEIYQKNEKLIDDILNTFRFLE